MKKILSICAVTALLCSSPSLSSISTENMVRESARKHGVPVSLALRVAQQESGIKCGRVGRAGERGPLQILPSTARGLGYKNIRNSSCATQLDAGMKHLAKCYRGMRGDHWKAAGCHNHGFGSIKTGKLSKHAQRYANAVMGRSSVKVSPASYKKSVPAKADNPISTFFSNLVNMKVKTTAAKPKTRYITNFN